MGDYKNCGHSTAEDYEDNFEKNKAEMKARNKEKNKKNRTYVATRRRKTVLDKDKYKDKNDIEKLEVVVTSLIENLIEDSKLENINKVDWLCPESRSVRKAQLSNVKDQISIVKSLKDLLLELQDADKTKSARILNDRNVITLIDKAQKKVKKNLAATGEVVE